MEVRRRSCKLDDFKLLLANPKIECFNIQYDATPEENQRFLDLGGKLVESSIQPLLNLDGFATHLAGLDGVISVDNSTVHLAAALGIPTLLLLSFPSASCWRWGTAEKETCIYPAIRKLRKSLGMTWASLLHENASEIRG